MPGVTVSDLIDDLTAVDELQPADSIPLTRAGLPYKVTGAALLAAGTLEGLPAANVSVEDTTSVFTGTTLQDILIGELDPTKFAKSTNGGAERYVEMTGVVGATVIDLAAGNVHRIASTAGNYSLSVTGANATKATSWMLIIDTTTTGHTPTWFSGITWMGGLQTITWTGGTRQVFSFLSYDGTTWMGWHLSPTAQILFLPASKTGTLTASTTVPFFTGPTNDSGEARTLVSVRATVTTVPTGAAIICDVHLGGTTAFTTQSNRPTIAISGTTNNATTIQNPTWAVGAQLTAFIDQVGSTIAGADLLLEVNYRQGS